MRWVSSSLMAGMGSLPAPGMPSQLFFPLALVLLLSSIAGGCSCCCAIAAFAILAAAVGVAAAVVADVWSNLAVLMAVVVTSAGNVAVAGSASAVVAVAESASAASQTALSTTSWSMTGGLEGQHALFHPGSHLSPHTRSCFCPLAEHLLPPPPPLAVGAVSGLCMRIGTVTLGMLGEGW